MLLILNKRAKLNYQITKTYECGVVLTGAEVKSLRKKSGSLMGSFVKAIDREVFLINAHINPYSYADNSEYDSKRTRKLLLTKKEIDQIITSTNKKGWTVVPLSFETVGPRIKLKIGLGKGKKEYEKREDIKKRDLKRELGKKMKNSYLKI